MMFAKAIALAAVLAVASGPVGASRPFDGVASWFAQHIKAAEAQLSANQGDSAPWFCHDLDCPKYKVLNSTAVYETREYTGGKWAVTKVQGLLYEPSVTVGFKRLFEYISGENEDGTKIPMTAPVLAMVEPGQGPFCKSNFTICFYVPEEFQEDTPVPTNKDVDLFEAPKGIAYVTQFGGFMVDEFTLASKVKALRADLAANDVSFVDDGSYVTASYDPPFRLQHRHNEVMLRASKASEEFVLSSK